MSDCLFCRIAGGEIPSKKVYEDESVYAFEDIAPKAPTHVLVIPKKHIARLADVSPADEALLGAVAARAASIARDRGLADFRLVALQKALQMLNGVEPFRAEKVLSTLSDPTSEPIPEAPGKGAAGAWPSRWMESRKS